MKITVYGGTNNTAYTPEEKTSSEKLGKYLAQRGAEILTGACRGFPEYVGRAALQHGAKVIGYSPAIDEKDHVENFQFPLDAVTHMEYKKIEGASQADNFFNRSLDMTKYSDICIAIGGSWGTYTELLFSFWYKKTIILIKGFNGAADAFHETYKFFDARDINPAVHHGSTIFVVNSVDEAIDKLEQLTK
ncbi:MAG: hypothetical protein FWE01_00080 [Firmicutes bacterium]|nr:hypothetical protein [Bacillota bacterium]